MMREDTEHGVVQFGNIELRYGLGRSILDNVSFTLAANSFHYLTGPSGSGKSSLLALILMALRPSRGQLSLFGQDTAQLSNEDIIKIRRHIGIVFQDFRLLDHLSLYENVALPLRVTGASETHYRKDVHELLDWVGLGEARHIRPPALSGGEKQRAAIARAVIAKPDLLLADEPTGNVDPAMAHRLIRLFQELNRSGTTVLLATHDETLIARFPASQLILEQGHVRSVT
jgi:cell division transport system ATP-binding protein